MKAHGFTLLEVLVYLTLSIMSISLLSMALGGMYSQVMSALTATNGRMQAHIALQCIKTDITHTSAIVSCTDEEIIVLHDGLQKRWVGWSLREKTLVRKHGSYDVLSHRWHHAVTQKLATGITSLLFKRSMNNGRDITIMLTLGTEAIEAHASQKIGLHL